MEKRSSTGGRVCEHLRGPHDPDHREAVLLCCGLWTQVLETCLKFMNLSEAALYTTYMACKEM